MRPMNSRSRESDSWDSLKPIRGRRPRIGRPSLIGQDTDRATPQAGATSRGAGAGEACSAFGVLPVAGLALGQPLQRLRKAPGAGVLSPGPRDPLDVLAAVAGGERVERLPRPGVLAHGKRGGQLRWHLRHRPGRDDLATGRRLHALLVELHRTADVREQPSSRRSEEHTSELQSLMRISYAVFCLKKKNTTNTLMTDCK